MFAMFAEFWWPPDWFDARFWLLDCSESPSMSCA